MDAKNLLNCLGREGLIETIVSDSVLDKRIEQLEAETLAEQLQNFQPTIETMPPQFTLRDRFACAALTGISFCGEEKNIVGYARAAFKCADAMLAARDRK
jgi:hypothetical protein